MLPQHGSSTKRADRDNKCVSICTRCVCPAVHRNRWGHVRQTGQNAAQSSNRTKKLTGDVSQQLVLFVELQATLAEFEH